MAPRRLRPGRGAKATILTRFIKPKQVGKDKNHRSEVILKEEFEDEKGKLCYSFRLYADEPSLYAVPRYLKIVEEGNVDHLFDLEEGEGGKVR